MARTLLVAGLLSALLASGVTDALATTGHRAPRSTTTHRRIPARAPASASIASDEIAVLAVAVAKRYWRATPCGGAIGVAVDRPLVPGLDPSTDAWVTFESSLGANNLDAPPSSYSHCLISLARWQWPTRAAMASDWNMFCLTVIHEVGHLLGHPHSSAPGSVMAPVFTDESSVPRICRATRVPRRAGA